MVGTVEAASKADALRFFTELAAETCAGQPLLRSLRKLQHGFGSEEPMEAVTRNVADAVEGGATLTEAMEQHPDTFNPAVLALVHAGEVAGVLDHILVLIVESSWRYPGRMV